jgi:Ca-activated chloride channel homolog
VPYVRIRPVCAFLLAASATASLSAQIQSDRPAEQPVFRASVEMVSMSAVVRNRQGRVVPALSREDFEVLDAGTRRPIIDLRAEVSAPASVALLVDSSGSMRVGNTMDSARLVAAEILDSMDEKRDEAALLTFDSRLLELQPFTRDFEPIRMRLEDLDAFGMTSLYDAIAEASRLVAPRARHRRAVIVLTDGADTNSQMTASEVSAAASSIDVPVYVFSLDGTNTDGPLVDLARWTGGEFYVANDQRSATLGIQRLMDELRHQYVIAFEPGASDGWRRVEIRTRRRDLTVRTRSWYLAGSTY